MGAEQLLLLLLLRRQGEWSWVSSHSRRCRRSSARGAARRSQTASRSTCRRSNCRPCSREALPSGAASGYVAHCVPPQGWPQRACSVCWGV